MTTTTTMQPSLYVPAGNNTGTIVFDYKIEK